MKNTFIKFIFTILITLNSSFLLAIDYLLGINSAQNANITSSISSPDKFYDDGGSSTGYSNNNNSTFTFNCNSGKYIRIKFNTRNLGSNDYLYVYDGTDVNAKLIRAGFTGSMTSSYMMVSSTGSLTIKFISDASGNNVGWDADVWVDDYPGQIWNGSISSDVSNNGNWEGNVIPHHNGLTSIYIPATASNFPNIDNTISSFIPFNLYINNNSSIIYSSNSVSTNFSIWGDFINNGTISTTGGNNINLVGGTTTYNNLLGGTGNFIDCSFQLGDTTSSNGAKIKMSNSISIKSLIFNSTTSGTVDLNNYNLTILEKFNHNSNYTFYQRSGILSLEGSASNVTLNSSKFEEGTGTTYFNSGENNTAISQTIPSITYYNLKIRLTNGITTYLGTSDFEVSNNLEIINPNTAGGILTSSTNTGTSIDVKGDLYLGYTGNAFTFTLNPVRIKNSDSDGIIYMGNNSNHIINLGRNSSTSINFEGFINPVFYGTVNYIRNGNQIVTKATYQNLTLSGSGTKTINGSITIFGNLTISGTSTFAAATNYDITIYGNWTNNGSGFTHANQTVTFNGSNSQTIDGPISTTFYNLTINNSSSDVYQNINTTISGNLTLLFGDLSIANNKNLTLNNASITSITGGNVNSHLVTNGNSLIIKTYASTNSINFPLGDGTLYRPLKLTPSNSNSTIWSIAYTPSQYSFTTIEAGSSLSSISNQEYWTCNRSGATPSNAVLEFTWIPENNITDYGSLAIAHFDGTDWNEIESTTNGTNTAGILTSFMNVSDFSPFTIGIISAIPLANQNLYLKGCKENEMNRLSWKSYLNDEIKYFEIQKSIDGKNFESISNIEKNSFMNEYFYIDRNPENNFYYKILAYIDENKFIESNLILLKSTQYNTIIKSTNIYGQQINDDYKGIIFETNQQKEISIKYIQK